MMLKFLRHCWNSIHQTVPYQNTYEEVSYNISGRIFKTNILKSKIDACLKWKFRYLLAYVKLEID